MTERESLLRFAPIVVITIFACIALIAVAGMEPAPETTVTLKAPAKTTTANVETHRR